MASCHGIVEKATEDGLMNEHDEQLSEWIATVRQEPEGSLPWRKAMNQLLLAVQQLPGLARSNHPDYFEALNDTLMRLSEEIREFVPTGSSVENSLVAWINRKLRLKYQVMELHGLPRDRSSRTRAKTALEEFKTQARQPPLSLDTPIGQDSSETFAEHLPDQEPATLWELEAAIAQAQAQQNTLRVGSQLTQYIQQDPEGTLRNCHPSAHPACNCQVLSQRLLLKHPPDKLANLAREFNINYHTLNWHWKNKGIPLLRSIAQNLGYPPDREL